MTTPTPDTEFEDVDLEDDSDEETTDVDLENDLGEDAHETTDVETVAFLDAVKQIEANWDAWAPTDPVKQLLKRAIDTTPERMQS